MKLKLIVQQREIDNSIIQRFQNPLPITDETCRQKHFKDIEGLNNQLMDT